MGYLEDHKAKFDNLRVNVDLEHRNQLRRTANGGNSIIFTYPPEEENLYLNKFEELNTNQIYYFVDISKLFINFIDKIGVSKIERKYTIFRATPHKVFNGFLDLIVSEIENVSPNQIPVLIRTGVLHGTGIENVNIMEHQVVMGLANPLVILYPSKIENDNLYFLNFKLASKYRCTVIR